MTEKISIRTQLTSKQRSIELKHTIDPGFVHQRKIQTILGQKGMEIIDRAIKNLPDIPDWERRVRINHIYTDVFLVWCKTIGIKPLAETIATKQGTLFCSTERLKPCEEIYDKERVESIWVPQGNCRERVEFHYSTRHILSDTLKSRLHNGGFPISIIAELSKYNKNIAVFDPIIMGSPWLAPPDGVEPDFAIIWYGDCFFENFIEDFDEFSQVKDQPIPSDVKPMRNISEAAFKTCLAELLGDASHKDWGGETSDYFTAHINLHGVRKTAAFLLKGPANFKPMSLNHLGKNNDQIVRLSHEPAQVLFVQHCHDILPPVRETLRAFAVQPSNPRRYCLIDGRDSLRLLKAYDLYDKALLLSKA